jgi:hypothetical protein
VTDLQAALERGQSLKNEIGALEVQLVDLRNQRDEVFRTGWEYVIRLRAGIKGFYGDDASQYELVGGTRRSERKPHPKRPKAAPAVNE